jgi:hypothetical protein
MHALVVLFDDAEHAVIYLVIAVVVILILRVFSLNRRTDISQGARIQHQINHEDAKIDGEYRKPLKKWMSRMHSADIVMQNRIETGREPPLHLVGKFIQARDKLSQLESDKNREHSMIRRIVGSDRGPRVEVNKKKGAAEIKRGIRRV